MLEWKNKTALVTGASYGIGEAFARRLAADGADLILTARSMNRLEALAKELRAQHKINVTIIEADLAQPTSPQLLFEKTESAGLEVDLLINNAGFGLVGDFDQLPLDRQLEMIQVNVTSLVALSHLFLQPMLRRRSGAILNLASTASFQGVPYFSVYAATKAYIMIFSEGLWAECQPLGVRIAALCPGPTESHFQVVAGTEKHNRPVKMQTAAEVVEVGLRALEENRAVAVSGFNNRAMVFMERLVPRSFTNRLATKLYRSFSIRPTAG